MNFTVRSFKAVSGGQTKRDSASVNIPTFFLFKEGVCVRANGKPPQNAVLLDNRNALLFRGLFP